MGFALVALALLGSLSISGGIPIDFTLLECPNDAWTFYIDLCYLPAVDFVKSQDHARTECEAMSADLATINVEDSTVLGLALSGAIHPDSRYWVEDNDTNVQNINCSFVGLTSDSDTEYGTAPCDTQGFAYICVARPNTSRIRINNQVAITDAPLYFVAAPSLTGDLLGSSTPSTLMNMQTKEDLQTRELTVDVGTPLISAAMPSISVNVTCTDPWFISLTGGSCYYIAPLFQSGNFFETSSFCMSLDGWLVEPSDAAEYAAIHDIVAHRTDWTDGPWVGLMRPSNDSHIVFLSSQKSPSDPDYQTHLKLELSPDNSTTTGLNCVGFTSMGDFGLYDCGAGGNPFCEKDLEYTVKVVNNTLSQNVTAVAGATSATLM